MTAEAKLSVIEQVLRLLSLPKWEFSRNTDGDRVTLTIRGWSS